MKGFIFFLAMLYKIYTFWQGLGKTKNDKNKEMIFRR